MVLPFWYRLTEVVPEKWLLNGCSSSSSTRIVLYTEADAQCDKLAKVVD